VKYCRENLIVYSLIRMIGALREYLCTFMIISRSLFLGMKKVTTKSVEKIKTYILCSITISENVLFMRKCGKHSTSIQATDDNIIRYTRFASWIPKVTDTHSEYAVHLIFHGKNKTRTLLYVTLHVRCLRYSKISGDKTFLSTLRMHCAKM
jgi:hypothetical protein